MALDSDAPFPFYADKGGAPLQGGSVYFGVSGSNPVTSPITVYWDEAGTQPAAQPITISAGRTTRNGTPARVWINGDFSRLVLDSNGQQVVYEATPPSNLRKIIAASDGSSKMGFIQAGTGMVARPMQAKAREIVSLLDASGVLGDGINNDTAGAKACLLAYAGKDIFAPPAHYILDDSLTIPSETHFHGAGPGSIIEQTTNNIPILYVQGFKTKVGSLQLQYTNLQTGHVWGNAIHCQLFFESSLERLHILNAYDGIYCGRYTTNNADATVNYIYSSSLSDIRISKYANRAMYLGAQGGNNSGNTLTNIYTVNHDGVGGFITTASGVELVSWDDGVINQLNIEHAIHTGLSLVLNTCGNLTINGLHFEGITSACDYGALIDVLGSRVTVNGMTVAFNTFNAANLYALFRMDNTARVMLSNLQERDNTITVPSKPRFYSTAGTPHARELGNIFATGFTVQHSGLTTVPPVMLQSDVEMPAYTTGTFVPVVTAGGGAITTVGAVTGTYTQIGRVYIINFNVTITTNGTGSGQVIVAGFPAACAVPGHGGGRENGVTGKGLMTFMAPGDSKCLITFTDATYPGANGAVMDCQVIYTV